MPQFDSFFFWNAACISNMGYEFNRGATHARESQTRRQEKGPRQKARSGKTGGGCGEISRSALRVRKS